MLFHSQVAAKLRTPEIIEILARGAHEANRTYCLTLGDQGQPDWDSAPDWQKDSVRTGVKGVLAGNSPEDSHKSWLEQRQAEGWKYGPIKNVEGKAHPDLVPYADLSDAARAKNTLFVTTVKTMTNALHHQLGLTPPPRDYAKQTEQLDFTVRQVFHIPACFSAGSSTNDALINLLWDFQERIEDEEMLPGLHFPDDGDDGRLAESAQMLVGDGIQGFLVQAYAARHQYVGDGCWSVESWHQIGHVAYGNTYDEAFDQICALVQKQRDQEHATVPA